MRTWHWVSSAVCLFAMLLFAGTGITLNHAEEIEAEPRRTHHTDTLSTELYTALARGPRTGRAPLPATVADWVAASVGVSVHGRLADWSEYEVYLSMPGPGSDSWLAIDRESGAFEYEATDRGWIAFLNDLHKGRHTGRVWAWFIDIFSVATIVFCITGLALLYLHARQRRSTWPLVGLGIVGPALLAYLLIH